MPRGKKIKVNRVCDKPGRGKISFQEVCEYGF
jgi:hypothetical protein